MKRNQGKGGLLGRIWRGGVMLSVLALGFALVSGLGAKHAEQAEAVAAEPTAAAPSAVQQSTHPY